MNTPVNKSNASMKQIGQKLKARREYLRLGQQDLAEALSMSRVNYTRIEGGHVTISAPDLAIIASYLGVPVAYFYDQMDNEQFRDEEAVRFYNGLKPPMKEVAKQQLKALFDAQDREAAALEPRTHGKRPE